MPPKWDLTSKTLQGIINYHLELMSRQAEQAETPYETSYGSTMFVIVIHEDCETHDVLFVSLTSAFYHDNEHVPILISCGVDAICKNHMLGSVWCKSYGMVL